MSGLKGGPMDGSASGAMGGGSASELTSGSANGASKQKTAVFTTHADKSLELIRPNTTDLYFYDEELKAEYPTYEQVYFRDPFNEAEVAKRPSVEKLAELLTRFFRTNEECRSMDDVRQVRDFYLDDKWAQYQKFGRRFMPETMLATQTMFWPGRHVLKKRMSCRCRDVHFAVEAGKLTDEYIIQRRVPIREEMRVFYERGEVVRLAETRSSKTEVTKVKALGHRELSAAEAEFVAEAMRTMPELDFAGVDLAILEDGGMVIVEFNRSPQFAGYYRVTGVNLAEKMWGIDD